MKERADRFNTGKPRWSLVDFKALEPMVEVLEFGAAKYSAHQWKQGLPVTETCDSLMRHLVSFMSGENKDPESNKEHIGHILANAMFISYMLQNKQEFDDRAGITSKKRDLSVHEAGASVYP